MAVLRTKTSFISRKFYNHHSTSNYHSTFNFFYTMIMFPYASLKVRYYSSSLVLLIGFCTSFGYACHLHHFLTTTSLSFSLAERSYLRYMQNEHMHLFSIYCNTYFIFMILKYIKTNIYRINFIIEKINIVYKNKYSIFIFIYF